MFHFTFSNGMCLRFVYPDFSERITAPLCLYIIWNGFLITSTAKSLKAKVLVLASFEIFQFGLLFSFNTTKSDVGLYFSPLGIKVVSMILSERKRIWYEPSLTFILQKVLSAVMDINFLFAFWAKAVDVIKKIKSSFFVVYVFCHFDKGEIT